MISKVEFAQWYEENYTKIVGYCGGLAGDPQTAEDMVHEVLIRMVTTYRAEDPEKYLVLDKPESLTKVAFRTAFNLHVDNSRKKLNGLLDELSDEMPANQLGVEQQAALRENTIKLTDIINSLPYDDRKLLIAKIDGLSLNEIALLTGKPLENVKSRLRRMRDRLNPILADWLGDY